MHVPQRRGSLIKSARELELMRRAGRIVRDVLAEVRERVRPGITTQALDLLAEAVMTARGGSPLFRGVTNPQARTPFPGVMCISVNEVLVHGVPALRELADGDLLTLDCGVRVEGYCADAAVTVGVGRLSDEDRTLLEIAQGALDLAIELMRPGRMWSEIATAMQAHVERTGFSVVRDFVGHGIGREMHELPKVPNFWDGDRRNMDFRLEPNLVLAVEPMVAAGGHEVQVAGEERWAYVMKDGRRCAHFEHTIAVTESGSEVLTA